MSIRIKNVNFSYGPKKVLSEINLEVKTGELIALMGLSGCGKTTLLRILLGLNELQEGKVIISDKPLDEKSKNLISYIPQHGALFPHLKVKENIFLPIKVKREITPKDIERCDDLAKICNIASELFERYPSELSGGQRQRVSILRALLMDTPYIFLDEPLSALDPITKISIQQEFKEVFKRENKTIIMVTHNLSETKYLCDKLAIIRDGKIEQYDSTENLLQRPNEGFVDQFITSQL